MNHRIELLILVLITVLFAVLDDVYIQFTHNEFAVVSLAIDCLLNLLACCLYAANKSRSKFWGLLSFWVLALEDRAAQS